MLNVAHMTKTAQILWYLTVTSCLGCCSVQLTSFFFLFHPFCCPVYSSSKCSSSFIFPVLMVFHPLFLFCGLQALAVSDTQSCDTLCHCHCFQSKHQKHQAFEAELHANADRIRGVIDTGNALIQRGACAGSEDAVQVNICSLCPRYRLWCCMYFNLNPYITLLYTPWSVNKLCLLLGTAAQILSTVLSTTFTKLCQEHMCGTSD